MSTNKQWLEPGSVAICEICFKQLLPAQCALDEKGTKWDICKGECAEQAGITEALQPATWREPCTCPSYYCPEDAALAEFCPVHGDR